MCVFIKLDQKSIGRQLFTSSSMPFEVIRNLRSLTELS